MTNEGWSSRSLVSGLHSLLLGGLGGGAVKRSVATIVLIFAGVPLLFGVTPRKRPSFCPLPENVTFDREQNPEVIGWYTGRWVPEAGPLYVRKFCILVTSIRGNSVRGIYSWETGGWDGPSGWRELETASTSFSTLQFRDLIGTDALTITLEFHKRGNPTATYSRTYRGFLGRRTESVLESRLVQIA